VSHVKTIAAFVAGALSIAAVHCSAAAQEVSVNDTARFIAGLPPSESSPLARLTKNPKWQAYAQSFNTNWEALEKRQLVHVRGWSDKHLQNRKAPLYYMFSGPDFLYANAFFPEASTYLMSGLETVGPVPTVSERTIAALPRIQTAIGSSVKLSFFITSQMGGLQSGDLPGALPIILVYAVRSGKTIEDITLISLDHDGNIQPPSNARNATPGVKITVRTGDGPPQTIYYFRTDVSNKGVSSSGFLAFADKLGQGQAFFKSASYLVQGSGFSMVRDFVLAHAQSIVQDDTGVPFSAFRPDQWEVSPFGVYRTPIPVFRGHNQPRLAELFRRLKAPPLDFRIGYGRGSSLILASKKADVAQMVTQTSIGVSRLEPGRHRTVTHVTLDTRD
jgi:hypothetical protein